MEFDTVTRVPDSVPAAPKAAPETADDHARLTELLEQARRSAKMHALRADILRNEADFYSAQARQMRFSTSWRLTWPLRRGVMLLRAILRRARRVARSTLRPEQTRA